MAGKDKDFTRADDAIKKMFSATSAQSNGGQFAEQPFDTQIKFDENDFNNTEHTHIKNDIVVTNDVNNNIVQNNAKHKKPTNVSKHYNERGKRDVRIGMLLDEQLREDLTLLSKATNSKSLNDLIITILLDYVDRKENQAKLEQYRKLLGLRIN